MSVSKSCKTQLFRAPWKKGNLLEETFKQQKDFSVLKTNYKVKKSWVLSYEILHEAWNFSLA